MVVDAGGIAMIVHIVRFHSELMAFFSTRAFQCSNFFFI